MTLLSRQQRRKLERDARRATGNSLRNREHWSGKYLEADDLRPYFADVRTADTVRDTVEDCLVQMLGTAPIPEKGFAVAVRISYALNGGARMVFAVGGNRACDPNQNSHIAIVGFLDPVDCGIPELRAGSVGGFGTDLLNFVNAAHSELRLPFAIVRDPDLERKHGSNCWLYQIRFNTAQAVQEGKLGQRELEMLGRGYIGVTRRTFAERINEHFGQMTDGGGHLLHSVWRDLRQKDMPHRVIAQLIGHSKSEDAIYEMEERAVENTLAPLGLNMIPGGRAGVRFLQRSGFSNAGFDNRDRLLAEAVQARESARTHYRSAHLREFRPGRFTMVSGHWVNAGKLAKGHATPPTSGRKRFAPKPERGS
jgi:hypothetical protein